MVKYYKELDHHWTIRYDYGGHGNCEYYDKKSRKWIVNNDLVGMFIGKYICKQITEKEAMQRIKD